MIATGQRVQLNVAAWMIREARRLAMQRLARNHSAGERYIGRPVELETAAVLGELALNEAAGGDTCHSWATVDDPGYDFINRAGNTVDVKGVLLIPHAHLLVLAHRPLRAERYALVLCNRLDWFDCWCAGWATRQELEHAPLRRMRPEYPLNRALPEEQLHRLEL